MSFSNDKARRINKYNGSELYDAYLNDEENGIRHSLTEMYYYSQCYYLCLTPKYKKVKRFTCDNCYFEAECIEKYHINDMRKQNKGCILGRPFENYYDSSDKLFSEIFKVKEGEYWIRYNRGAHKLWQNVYVSLDRYNCGPFLGHEGGR